MPKKKGILSKDLPGFPGNHKTGVIVAPKQEVKQKSCEGVAYKIKDPAFGILEVRNSANAWFTDKEKVQKMIDAFKLDCTILEMCYYVGISKDQYDYFRDIHPDFSYVLDILREFPVLKARKRVVKGIDESFDNALRYLERKRRAEFATRVESTGADGAPLYSLTDDQAEQIAQTTLKAIESRRNVLKKLKESKK